MKTLTRITILFCGALWGGVASAIDTSCHLGVTTKLESEVAFPLHKSARDGNIEKTIELLKQGYDPNGITLQGNTPLGVAIFGEGKRTPPPVSTPGNFKMPGVFVLLVLDAGADANVATRDCKGDVARTTLEMAMVAECVHCIQPLIALGANPFKANGKGITPIELVRASIEVAEKEGSWDAHDNFKRILETMTMDGYTPEYMKERATAVEAMKMETGAYLLNKEQIQMQHQRKAIASCIADPMYKSTWGIVYQWRYAMLILVLIAFVFSALWWCLAKGPIGKTSSALIAVITASMLFAGALKMYQYNKNEMSGISTYCANLASQ